MTESFFLLFVSFFFKMGVSLCSFGTTPGTRSLDQAVLEHTGICLPMPSECWNSRYARPESLTLRPDWYTLVHQTVTITQLY